MFPESRPAPPREDVRARAGPQPAVPVCPRRPAPDRLVPPAGERSRAAGLWLLAPPCCQGRALGPIAAAVTLPPPQVLPRRGPGRCSAAPPELARSGAPGTHKPSARALRCLRRVQCRAGSFWRGCCTGCPEEQVLRSGLQLMNGFLRLSVFQVSFGCSVQVSGRQELFI